MPPAIIAAGVVGAATIGGAALASSSSKSAAKTAANTAQNVANQNNALQGQIYGNNVALADPWRQSGLQANNTLNAMLGLGGGQSGGAPPAPANDPSMGSLTQPNALGGGGYGGPGLNSQMALSGNDLPPSGGRAYASPQQYGAPIPYNPVDSMGATGGQPPAGPASPASSNPFASWLGSTNYNFTLGQGLDAVNKGYAARGTLQSGAAMKALNNYGQNTANGYLQNYENMLANQAGVGLSATNAVMGVGTNYANQVSANNNSAGSAAGNAALAAGAQNSNLFGNVIPNALGNFVGQSNLFGSSYGGGALKNFANSTGTFG